MTIDKADLVKRLKSPILRGAIRMTDRGADLELALNDAITYITQQSQERDEVLEEAASVADASWINEDGTPCLIADEIAKEIRALKSPSHAPLERRSEVECPKAEDGQHVFIAQPVQDSDKGKCDNCGEPCVAAQPEPQGLRDGADRGGPVRSDLDASHVEELHKLQQELIAGADRLRSEATKSGRWVVAIDALLDRRAAITGGK